MSKLEQARALARTIEVTAEMRALGEDNVGMFADEGTRLFYYDGMTRFLNTELSANEIGDSLFYRVEFEESPIGDEMAVPLGNSKFRGLPHLPPDFDWPKGQLFAAQINLADFARYDIDGYLPKAGMLYLFFSGEGAETIHYYDGPIESLTITEYPDHVDLKYYGEFRKGANMKWEPGWIFYIDADDEYEDFPKLVPKELSDQISSVFGCAMANYDRVKGLFGRAQWWQGEDEIWADDEPPEETDRLLFQFEFGEGHIHFWFDPDEGSKGNFEKAWVSYSGT